MSNIEYEAKIYDVIPADIVAKLARLGAKEIGSYNFRRYVFDTIPATPNRWVRLRSDGQHATLTVKEITAEAIDGTHEWEVEVSDLETTLEILAKIGLNHVAIKKTNGKNMTWMASRSSLTAGQS